MKILFVMLHPGYVRNYESTLRLLTRRGHRIHLAFNHPRKQAEEGLVERLAAETDRITFGAAARRIDRWRYFVGMIRGVMDYLRYWHPRYANAPKLRARVEQRIPLPAWVLRQTSRLARPALIDALTGVLTRLEQTVPCSRQISQFLETEKPDVVLVTPLVNMASDQVDYIKSARRLGIRTALCVASWDNLTNKGLIRLLPDRVIVWNEIQLREAVELHGVPAPRVVVTGAQRFDDWFERGPSSGREAFARRAGLDPARPYVLYVCSSPFIAADEPRFVESWIRHLRASGEPMIRSLGVLIRPHPQNADPWRTVDFSSYGNVSVWPRGGANPVSEEAKADFFDSLYHSEAAVGLNTSAFLEAAIVGVPSFTVLAEDFADTQAGTLHFHYLVGTNGGVLHTASTLGEHEAQLLGCLADKGAWRKVRTDFIRSFLRPHGLERPCTPLVAGAIEELGKEPGPDPEPDAGWVPLARAACAPVALMVHVVALVRRGKASALGPVRIARKLKGSANAFARQDQA